MRRKNFPKAVIFDLDGVITQTARLHFLAWKKTFDDYLKKKLKEFKEFTYKDYLLYVDGKPRYEGVRSFLSSRDIKLAWGAPSDSPEKETICGLGNKKNVLFRSILKKEKPEVFSSTIRFIKELRKRRIKIAVASSSKNCSLILKSAKIENLFSVRVDGKTLERLNLKGKPNPDMFIKTAERLKVSPKETVVVEDASSGVEAARKGGFGLVVGIARKKNEKHLLDSGADVVVKDLAFLDIEWINHWFRKTPFPLFIGLKSLKKELRIFEKEGILLNSNYFVNFNRFISQKKNLVFFFDYDGTLTPIVSSPDEAHLSEKMRKILEKFSKKFFTVIISGRMIKELKRLINIGNIIYAGIHGLEIEGKDFHFIFPKAKKLKPIISQIKEKFIKTLGNIPGIFIEDKKLSIALHYRQVDEKFFKIIEKEVERCIKNNKELRIILGKKVFEIIPAGWNKAFAVGWILDKLGFSSKKGIVYFGDNTTDEDVFYFLRTKGVGVLVSKKVKKSGAQFYLQEPSELEKLLDRLAK